LVLLVGVSTLVRAAIAFAVASPWIVPDEVVYSDLAKSIAAGHRPSVRDLPVFGWGEVYPTLIAPVWMVFDNALTAYRATLVVNGFLMSLAAVPAYFLSRLFASRRLSLVVASMCVLVPSMSMTGTVMTENACYPAFVLAVLLIARALRGPTIGNQALALLGIGVVSFARIQSAALVGAYLMGAVMFGVTAGNGGASYLRRFWPSVAFMVPVVSGPFVLSLLRGDGLLGWLGARSGTFANFHPDEVPQWALYLTADLVLYVAVAPLLAAAVMMGRGLSHRATDAERLFGAVAFPTFLTIILSVALVSASLDVDGTENLNERYVFYVVPLAFVGCALWLQSGMPRPRPWSWLLIVACCLLTAFLPIDRLSYNAAFQSVALLPWIGISTPTLALAVIVGAFTLACGFLWIRCRRERSGRIWLLTGSVMAVTGMLAVGANAFSASNSANAFDGVSPTWVDDAVPKGTRVAVLWDERRARPNKPDPFYTWIMVTEMLNPSLGTVYRLGPPTYYEGFLPTVPVEARDDGRVVAGTGTAVRGQYMLVSCRTPIEGKIIATAPRSALQLVRVSGTVRLSTARACTRPGP
jgi:hypothetical protein